MVSSYEQPERRPILPAFGTPTVMSRRQCLAAFAALPFAARASADSNRRIVAIDKVAAHTLLALGVTPVAAGAIQAYARLGIDLPPSVIEIGVPVEPNLELLQQIKPDLFLTHFDVPRARPRLERIAPVFVMDIYRGDGRTLENARSEMLRLAEAIGRETEARRYIAHVEAVLAERREALGTHHTRPLYLVPAWSRWTKRNGFRKKQYHAGGDGTSRPR